MTVDQQEHRRHIAAVIQRSPSAASYDVDLWLTAIARWEEPLPADRPWLRHTRRHRPTPVGLLAGPVSRTFHPPAGTVPQPRCPDVCWAAHGADTAAA